MSEQVRESTLWRRSSFRVRWPRRRHWPQSCDLRVDDAVVIHNSNKLALRLLPCDVFARVALIGQEVAALEVELALRLAATASPVAALEPRVEPRVYERDGFDDDLVDLLRGRWLLTWTHQAHTQTRSIACTPACEASRSRRRTSWTESQRLQRLVTHRDETPALAEADRHLLLSTLQDARERIHSRGAAEQLLHGEPHPGNLLSTQDGLLFIDFETCCRGPIEFDVAHVPRRGQRALSGRRSRSARRVSTARACDGRCLALGRPR